MRIAKVLCAIALACAACAQNPAPETTAAIVGAAPTVVVVEKKVIVEKPVIVTKTVIVEKKIYVEKSVVKASGSRCHYVRPYTRKNGTKVSGYTRCKR